MTGTTAQIPQEVETMATICVDCGLTVHKILGPGFKEPIYREAFRLELDSRGVPFEVEKAIGVKLTSAWQLDPEQSTAAIVVHHPAAKYFTAG